MKNSVSRPLRLDSATRTRILLPCALLLLMLASFSLVSLRPASGEAKAAKGTPPELSSWARSAAAAFDEDEDAPHLMAATYYSRN